MNGWLLFFHLVGAAVFLGGLVTMGALVPAMRRAGVERPQIQAVARRFGMVSWTALAVTIGVGLVAVAMEPEQATSLRLFEVKMVLVAIAVGLALWHQFWARSQTAATRGIVQGLILLSTILVYAIAAGW